MIVWNDIMDQPIEDFIERKFYNLRKKLKIEKLENSKLYQFDNFEIGEIFGILLNSPPSFVDWMINLFEKFETRGFSSEKNKWNYRMKRKERHLTWVCGEVIGYLSVKRKFSEQSEGRTGFKRRNCVGKWSGSRKITAGYGKYTWEIRVPVFYSCIFLKASSY